MPLDDFFDLIKTNKEILQIAIQLDSKLILRLKDVISLQQILRLIDALYLNDLLNIANVKKIIQYFKEEIFCLKLDKKGKLCENLHNFFKFLEKIFGKVSHKKDFDYYKLLSSILLDEFNKINYSNFRDSILEIILSKDEYIKNSSQIIKIIIENAGVDCIPEVMEANIENIMEEEDFEIFVKLNNTNNPFI